MEILRNINHENIIKFLDHEETPGETVIVFELMDIDLARHINNQENKKLNSTVTLNIIQQVLQALQLLKVK